jgi:cytosine/adenosine deaminase-related metal-dependent hydrolase
METTADSGVRTYSARWVFPVAGPPLERGTVSVRGDRIEAVVPRGVRTPNEDLGNVAIIPGLVNAHTHLDLSGARGLIPPTDPDHFTDWLKGVIAYRRTLTPQQTQADIRTGLAECLKFGTTLIGDIASEGASWDAVSAAKTRAVVFWELIGLSQERAVAASLLVRGIADRLTAETILTPPPVWGRSASEASREGGGLNAPPSARTYCSADLLPTGGGVKATRLGFSPHAPYSVGKMLLKDVWGAAREHRIPVVTHLAETSTEQELLTHHRGPFATFLRDLGLWHPSNLTQSWEDWVNRRKRRAPDLYIHANYLTPTRRIPPNGSIVYCPRTHAAFGHPSHPFRDFLARGVRVCLGTDSLASNPDLDILAEARFMRSRYPDFPGDQLLRMVTLSGAEALGWADECGSLETGKSADFVVIPLPNEEVPEPHDLILRQTDVGERRTMWRGEWRS